MCFFERTGSVAPILLPLEHEVLPKKLFVEHTWRSTTTGILRYAKLFNFSVINCIINANDFKRAATRNAIQVPVLITANVPPKVSASATKTTTALTASTNTVH